MTQPLNFKNLVGEHAPQTTLAVVCLRTHYEPDHFKPDGYDRVLAGYNRYYTCCVARLMMANTFIPDLTFQVFLSIFAYYAKMDKKTEMLERNKK